MNDTTISIPTCIDLDAGPGTRALGIESAGFTILAVSTFQPVDNTTIAANRPDWTRIDDWLPDAVEQLPALAAAGVTLLSAHLLTPQPYSGARCLDPIARAATVLNPQAILLEGVQDWGHSDSPTFTRPFNRLAERLDYLGYTLDRRILDGAEHGSPTHYHRTIAIALRPQAGAAFAWPQNSEPVSAGAALAPTWAARSLAEHADAIAARAAETGPEVKVFTQRNTGRPFLGPAAEARGWNRLGFDFNGIDPDETPATTTGPAGAGPRLSPTQLAALKGIPATWRLDANCTNGMYQAADAFPPPFAAALATSIATALGAVTAC